MVRKVYYFSTLADKNSPFYATSSNYTLSTHCRIFSVLRRYRKNSGRSEPLGAGVIKVILNFIKMLPEIIKFLFDFITVKFKIIKIRSHFITAALDPLPILLHSSKLVRNQSEFHADFIVVR